MKHDTRAKVAGAAHSLRPFFTLKEATERAELPRTTVAYHLKKLCEIGLLEVTNIGLGRGHSTKFRITSIDNLRKYWRGNDIERFEVEQEIAEEADKIDNRRGFGATTMSILATRRSNYVEHNEDYEQSEAAQSVLGAIFETSARYFTYAALTRFLGRSVKWVRDVLEEIIDADLVSVARRGLGQGMKTFLEVKSPETIQALAYG